MNRILLVKNLYVCPQSNGAPVEDTHLADGDKKWNKSSYDLLSMMIGKYDDTKLIGDYFLIKFHLLYGTCSHFCIIIGIALLLFALFTSARMGIYQVYIYIYNNMICTCTCTCTWS